MYLFLWSSVLQVPLKRLLKEKSMTDGAFNSVTEENYLESQSFIQESENLIGDLTRLLGEYKNEEHILNGGSISEEELCKAIEQILFYEFISNIK